MGGLGFTPLAAYIPGGPTRFPVLLFLFRSIKLGGPGARRGRCEIPSLAGVGEGLLYYLTLK